MKIIPYGIAVAMLCLATSPAEATNSRPELEAVQRDLLAWLPGEYDTLAQVDLEQRLGAPPDGTHERQYRVFGRVAVPHLAQYAIYGEVHGAGKDSPVIPGQQVLYLVSIDEKRGAVNVSGRRIKGGPDFEWKNLTPERQRQIALDPDYGGNCDFLFRRHGRDLVGVVTNIGSSDPSCTMVSKRSGQTMRWEAEWVVTPQELWIFDNGYIIDPRTPQRPGRLFAGRADRTHERMYKGRDFRCVGSGRTLPNGAVRGTLYDRGGQLRLTGSTATPGVFAQLLRAGYPTSDGADLVDRLTLTLWRDGESVPFARRESDGQASAIAIAADSLRIACERMSSAREARP